MDAKLCSYQCEFQAISHYLINEQSISEEECDCYLWFGFHEDTCCILEQHLAITHPDHPRMKPYKFADIFKTGKYIFEANAFHNSPPEGLDGPSHLLTKAQGGALESQVSTRTVMLLPPPSSIPGSDNLDSLVQQLWGSRICKYLCKNPSVHPEAVILLQYHWQQL